jgi:predicted RNA-binding Zn-ribbon protein involved in translation (DUF1610 family)
LGANMKKRGKKPDETPGQEGVKISPEVIAEVAEVRVKMSKKVHKLKCPQCGNDEWIKEVVSLRLYRKKTWIRRLLYICYQCGYLKWD